MSIPRLVAVLFATVLFVPTAHAAPVELPSRVESVTVFPSGVSIRRTGTIHTEAGPEQLVFGPLPVELSDATIRIGGFGPDVNAQSVSVRVGQRAELLAPRVADLAAQQAAIARRREALAGRRPSLARLTTGDASAARQRATEALADLDRQLAEVDRQLAALATALAGLRQEGQQSIKLVTVDVDAARAGELSLSIEYMVPGAAGWQPTYAARLDPATGRIALDLFASVQQRTGEDWTDVGVSLSTIVPASGLALPTFDEWQLALAEPAVEDEVAFGPRAAREAGRPMAGTGGADLEELAAPPLEPSTPISERAGVAEANLLAASIAIPGRISIGSDAPPRRLLASHSDFQSALEHHAAPRQSSSVFLAARFRNASEVPLLAGPAALFVGTDYVGTTSIAQTATEDEVVLPFGVDTGVTIDRTLAGRDTTPAGGRVRSTVRFGFRLNNHRDRAVDVIVLDQLPVSRSAGLTVAVVPGSRPADPHVDGEPQSLVRWRVHADAHANERWTFGYTVTTPRGGQLDGAIE